MTILTGNPSAVREVVGALQTFLLANTAGKIQKVYAQFPATNEKLVFPAMSIIAKDPKFTPAMPYVVEKIAAVEGDVSQTVRRVVGQYDIAMQMDLWAAYKPQRDSLYEDVFNAFNLNEDVPGISLQLSGYYDQWVHFSLAGMSFIGDEAADQRGEWRVLIQVLATVNAITEKVADTIQTIENNLETPESIDVPEEDAIELLI